MWDCTCAAAISVSQVSQCEEGRCSDESEEGKLKDGELLWWEKAWRQKDTFQTGGLQWRNADLATSSRLVF